VLRILTTQPWELVLMLPSIAKILPTLLASSAHATAIQGGAFCSFDSLSIPYTYNLAMMANSPLSINISRHARE
jgi:hypothetical protein